MYLFAVATDWYQLAYFVLALMNAFTFIPRKKHENPPDKLIVTKFIRQKKKHQKQSCKPTKIFMTISGKSIPPGSAK